jgi:hypothetical protein
VTFVFLPRLLCCAARKTRRFSIAKAHITRQLLQQLGVLQSTASHKTTRSMPSLRFDDLSKEQCEGLDNRTSSRRAACCFPGLKQLRLYELHRLDPHYSATDKIDKQTSSMYVSRSLC